MADTKEDVFEEVFGETRENVISGLEVVCEDRCTAIEFFKSLRKNLRTMGIDIPEEPVGKA